MLVDTGAEVNLVRRGLFSEDDVEPARSPVFLETVNGEPIAGGDKTLTLTFDLFAQDCGTDASYWHSISDDFYLSDITCDVIISHDLLLEKALVPVPHRKCLLWERPDGWTWLFAHPRDTPVSRSSLAINGSSSLSKATSWHTNDYAVRDDLVKLIIHELGGGMPQVDAFASTSNARFPLFWDVTTDAFSKDWGSHGLLWINPPFDLFNEVLDKIILDGALAILIAPEWPSEEWWHRLQPLVVRSFVVPKNTKVFLRRGLEPVAPPRWRTCAFLVDGLLGRPLHKVQEIIASQMAPLEGCHTPLSTLEISLVDARLQGGEPTFGVRSVVKSPPHAPAPSASLQGLIENSKASLVDRFKDSVLSGILSKDPPVRGPFGLAKIALVPGASPKRHRSFKMMGEREAALKTIIEEYVDRGWLEPSFSEWGSPCFVVPKKSVGDWRLVVDYRALNAVTLHDSYELPLIADMLQRQQRGRIFTVLDMKKGYHQMPLAPESRPFTAMVTHMGLWQWKVMPMGAKNGNAAFQRMMEWVLRDLPFAEPFVDDVIISTDGDGDELITRHADHVRQVLETLEGHQLVCDLAKAQMFVPEVEFCGHVLGHGCRRPSPGKLSALAKWPRPTNVTELRAFLGFCNWYSDYVKDYATHAGPLHTMLQLKRPEAKAGSKLRLHWTDEANSCFNAMKDKLCARLSLHLIDPDRDFVIHTDSSGYAVGAVLEQDFEGKLCPVAFWSRKLTPGQRKWSPESKKHTPSCVLSGSMPVT